MFPPFQAKKQNVVVTLNEIKSQFQFLAIRAGDYRYFDQVDKDIDIPLVPPKEIDDEEYDSYDPMPFSEVKTTEIIYCSVIFRDFAVFWATFVYKYGNRIGSYRTKTPKKNSTTKQGRQLVVM